MAYNVPRVSLTSLESNTRKKPDDWPELIDTEAEPRGNSFPHELLLGFGGHLQSTSLPEQIGWALGREVIKQPILRNVVVTSNIGFAKNGSRLVVHRPLRISVVEQEQTFTARVSLPNCSEGYGIDLNQAVRSLLSNIVAEYEANNPTVRALLTEIPSETEDEAMFEKHASPQAVSAFLDTMRQMPVAQKQQEIVYTDEELGYA